MAKYKVYLPVVIPLLLVLIGYWGLHQTFYQQDEWQEIGLLYSGVITPNPFDDFSFLELIFGQGRVFSDLMLSFFLLVFPFNMGPLAFGSLFLHALNVFLVYKLAIRLTKNQFLACTAASLFAINAVAHQAVTWGAAIATLPATALILGALLSYLHFLETDKKKFYYLAFGLAFGSLLFKEIGIFLFILLPILYALHKKASWKAILQVNWLFLVYGLAIVIFRTALLVGADSQNGTFVTGGNFGGKVLVHLFLYPLTGLFQALVPSLPMYEFAESIAKLQYPYLRTTALAEIVPQTIITDLVTLFGSVILIGLVYMINKKNNEHDSQLLFVAFGLALLSFLPYAVLDRGGSYMDSRYYYVAAIGASLVIGYLIIELWKRTIMTKIIAALLLVVLVSFHWRYTRAEIATQVDVARQRQTLLRSFKDYYPVLPAKTIVYLTGNRDHYIAANKAPLQQGVGYTLMVWYYGTETIPKQFLADKFLWDQGSEGYEEIGSQGFGFFTDLTKLQATYQEFGLSSANILAFYWDSENQRLEDITNEIRTQLP